MQGRSAQILSLKNRRALAENLAQRVLASIDEQKLAARFIDGYAQRYGRKELVIHADRNRELQSIFEREIVLAILARLAAFAELRRSSPVRSARKQGSFLGNTEQFLNAVLEAIGEQRGWTAGDIVEIGGELRRYREVIAKSSRPGSGASKPARYASQFQRSGATGPFVDRCAFVLDPSMMENARVASARFLREVESTADRLFEEALSAIQSAK